MRQASKRIPDSAEKTVRDIRRATRRQHSAEEKIRIVLEGLRGENSIAELCRKEGINQNLYYRWSKEFLEAGKKRLAGDTAREATSDEVKELKAEARQLKETLAEGPREVRHVRQAAVWPSHAPHARQGSRVSRNQEFAAHHRCASIAHCSPSRDRS
jgi:transposase